VQAPWQLPNYNPNVTGQAALLRNDDQSIGFVGLRKDEDTGLYYAQARWYDPLVGGFNAMDPAFGNVQSPITLNKYAWANANPTVYVDRDGRCGVAANIMPAAMQPACGMLDAAMIGTTPFSSEGRSKIDRFRNAQGKQLASDAWDTAKGLYALGRDVETAMVERATGLNFGADERIGARVNGLVEYNENLPVNLINDFVDYKMEVEAARASRNPELIGEVTAPVYGAAYSAVGGAVGTAARVPAMLGKLDNVPHSRPHVGTPDAPEEVINLGDVVDGHGDVAVENPIALEAGTVDAPSAPANTSRLRDERGRYMADPNALPPTPKPPSGNRNARSTQEPTIVYRIDVDGQGRKVGVTSEPPTGAGQYDRPRSQVRELQKHYGPGVEVEYRVRKEFSNRSDALDYENVFLERFKRLYGEYPGETLPGGNRTNR
jgi:RHS repeat-associated protein